MDHTEALESNASDRYALNMLSAAEVDAFEEHYFDCATCAEDVRLGMSLMDGGRRLVRETEAAPAAPAPNVVPIDSHPRRKFLAWIPAAAAAALLVVNGGLMMRIQQAVPAALPVPAAIAMPVAIFGTTTQLDLGTPRSGAEDELTVTPGATIVLSIPPPPANVRYSRYEAQLLGSDGKTRESRIFNENEAAAGPTLTILGAGPGKYELVLIGIEPLGQRGEIARRAVIVKPAEKRKGETQ